MVAARRAWAWLGSPTSVRIITGGMVAYALILAMLVAGYARVSACLTDYNNASAGRTAAIAAATDADRAAQLQLADALAAADDWSDVRSAAETWAVTTREGNRARADNPPPAPPSARC